MPLKVSVDEEMVILPDDAFGPQGLAPDSQVKLPETSYASIAD